MAGEPVLAGRAAPLLAGEGKRWFPHLATISVLVALVAALVEETLFRGYLLGALTRLQNRFWMANLLQAMLFTSMAFLFGQAALASRWVLTGNFLPS